MMTLVTITTVLGNAAVVAAIQRTSPRFPTHYPLASLAVADLMLGLCVLPLAAARELFVFQPSWLICACWSMMDVFCCTASILSLCTLGWERWSGITNPLARAKRLKYARLFAVLVWPASVCVAVPTTFIPSQRDFDMTSIKACTVNTNVGYVFFSVSLSFYIPATCMTFWYARILIALATPPKLRAYRGRTQMNAETCREIPRTAVAQSNEANKAPNKSTENTSAKEIPKSKVIFKTKSIHIGIPSVLNIVNVPSPLKTPSSPCGIIPRQRRATQTIVTLMSVFMLCWTPFFVMLPIDSVCGCVSETTWLVCTWLGYMNSALDPLVYAAASPTVRKSLPWLMQTCRSNGGSNSVRRRT